MKKRKKIVVKAREKKVIDYSNEVFWFFIQCCMSFLHLNNPKTAKINFDLTEI
jgi:hypothetical protein